MPNQFQDASTCADRLNRILLRTIKTIRIMASLKEFKRSDWEHLNTLVTPIEYSKILQFCRRNLDDQNLPFTRIKYQQNQEPSAEETDKETCNVINIFSNNKPARNFCLTFTLSESMETFLGYMNELCASMKERLSRNKKQEEKHISYLQELYQQNVALDDKIMTIRCKIHALESWKLKTLSTAQKDIKRYDKEIEIIRDKFDQKIKEKVHESELQMVASWRSGEFLQAGLLTEVKIQEEVLESLIKEKLAREKLLRQKRFKVESQLVTLLEKYDKDIGDRHRQKEELSKKLQEETLELQLLQTRFDTQELEYNTLMHDKELYDQRILQEKLLNIRKRAAARTIQRAFRKYLEKRHRGKKRGRKGKGKKK